MNRHLTDTHDPSASLAAFYQREWDEEVLVINEDGERFWIERWVWRALRDAARWLPPNPEDRLPDTAGDS